MNNKQVKRLFDLNKRANSCEPFTSEEITERNDLQFLRNNLLLLAIQMNFGRNRSLKHNFSL